MLVERGEVADADLADRGDVDRVVGAKLGAYHDVEAGGPDIALEGDLAYRVELGDGPLALPDSVGERVVERRGSWSIVRVDTSA